MFKRCSSDALAGAAAVLAAVVVALVDAGAPARDVTVLSADFGVSLTVIAVINIVGALFGLFKGKVDSGTKFALEGMRAGIADLGRKLIEGLVGVGGLIARAVGAIARFIKRVFGPLFQMLVTLVQRVARILQQVFGPIIEFLDKIRVHLKKFYDKVLRPIIDAIELVRSILRVLSFFGIEWSKKLDQKLAELEGYVLEPYLFLVGKLNEISNWINRIVTLDGLLQRVTLLTSLLRDVGYTNNLFWNSQTRAMTPGERARYGRGIDPKEGAAAIIELREAFGGGNSKLRAQIDEVVANVRIDLRGARGG